MLSPLTDCLQSRAVAAATSHNIGNRPSTTLFRAQVEWVGLENAISMRGHGSFYTILYVACVLGGAALSLGASLHDMVWQNAKNTHRN